MCNSYSISIILLFANCFLAGMSSVSALANVNESIYWPHHGDRVTKTHYEYFEVNTDTTIWDFSHAIETGDRHEMRWLNFGDSLLVKIEQGVQSMYQLFGDTLLWKGYESPLLSVHDSIAPIYELTAISKRRNISSPMYFHGSYCDNHAIDMIGAYSVTIGLSGTLILPNDTINDIFCVTTAIDCFVRVSKHQKDSPINNGTDSLLRLIETINRWYSPSYRYPLAENTSKCLYKDNTLLSQNKMTCLCIPDEQEYALGTFQIPKGLKKDAYPDATNNRCAAISNDSSLADRIIITQGNDELFVEVNTINLYDTSIQLLLCDIQGHVWYSQIGATINGFFLQNIDTAMFPPGYYFLLVRQGEEKHLERIRIK